MTDDLNIKWTTLFENLVKATELPDGMASDIGARFQRIYSEHPLLIGQPVDINGIQHVIVSVARGDVSDKMPAWGVPGEVVTPGVEVTEEMVMASIKEIIKSRGLGPHFIWFDGQRLLMPTIDEWREFLIPIYRAMHAVAPVLPVSEGERQAVRERDEARRDAQSWREHCAQLVRQQHVFRAELQAAHDILGTRPTPVPDPPKPEHNPFREFPSSRMIGR